MVERFVRFHDERIEVMSFGLDLEILRSQVTVCEIKTFYYTYNFTF